jgi:hypothetical protein
MSRILVIGSDTQVSRKIGDALAAADFPMEYSIGHADALQRLRMRSFGVVITNPHTVLSKKTWRCCRRCVQSDQE